MTSYVRQRVSTFGSWCTSIGSGSMYVGCSCVTELIKVTGIFVILFLFLLFIF